MNKLIATFCLTVILSICVLAQNSDDDYERNEFYAGFSHQQVGNRDHIPFNGFEVSYVRNVHRYFGIKGDFSAAYRNNDFSFPAFTSPTGTLPAIRGENRRSLYNVLGGIQIKDNATKARFKPFAHALVGVAHNRNRTKVDCTGNCSPFVDPDFTFFDTGVGGAFGGFASGALWESTGAAWTFTFAAVCAALGGLIFARGSSRASP